MALYLRILSDETDPDEMEVPPPSSLSSFEYQHNRRFANVLLICAALFVASLFLSIIYYAVLRRRRRRRLHSFAAADLSVGGNQDDGSSSEEGDPLHHVWYIRTVGLEESTISSISVTEYRAGEGHLENASTCSVCLGEFYDGDRIRLLPKCAHAFHVPCIDTWLRAHVNCPLCRALIVDPQGEPALAGPDPSTSTSSESTNSVSVSSSVAGRHIGNPLLHEQQNGGSQTSIDVVVITVNPFGAFDSLPESSSSQEKIDTGANSLQPVTRSVSMDTPLMNSVVVRIESGQTIFDKDGKDPNFTGASAGNCTPSKELKLANHRDRSDMERSVSTNGRGFFFSRHGLVARMHSMPM